VPQPRTPSLRLKNTLLPPRLPLLLPRRLTIPKRKPTRPLIRPRRLAHPSHIPTEQKRPRPETKQRSITHQARRESETPPAHQLRVQVERRHGLERHRHRRSRFAQFIRSGCSRTARRRPGVGAAAQAVFAAAPGGRRGAGGGGLGLGPDGDHAGEYQVRGCEREQREAEGTAEVGFEVGGAARHGGVGAAEGDDEAWGEEEGEGLEGAPGGG